MILSKIDSFFRLALEFGLNMLNLTKSDASYSCGCLCMCVFVCLCSYPSRVTNTDKGLPQTSTNFSRETIGQKRKQIWLTILVM